MQALRTATKMPQVDTLISLCQMQFPAYPTALVACVCSICILSVENEMYNCNI